MNATVRRKRPLVGLITALFLSGAAALVPASRSFGQAVAGCETTDQNALIRLINDKGLKEFSNPPEPSARPNSEATRLDLVVGYTDIDVLGCPARLRTYNQKIVGPTIRARPGETIHLRLVNQLPVPTEFPMHPQQPAPAGHSGHGHPFSFNITNLHTHGLNVAPQGPVDQKSGKVLFESDNVLLELGPGEQQDYRIEIHKDHPTGTFWYHAHVHGATAVQLSSGMAGALIIEDGTADNGDLDTVPAIAQVRDKQKIFVLQQLAYDQTGQVEDFAKLAVRPTTVNGQLVPVIRMQPGEVQRWRFVHAGVQENVALALDGHPIHEVAADGITLGRSVPWAAAPASGAVAANTLFLAPGYRSDVLVQARQPEPGKKYFLRKLALSPPQSIQAQERAFARTATGLVESLSFDAPPVDPGDFVPGQILAQLVIEGPDITDQRLPDSAQLSGLVPKDLSNITQAELDASNAPQEVILRQEQANCSEVDGLCTPCPGCPIKFQVGHNQFSMNPTAIRELKLHTNGKPTAAQWTVNTTGGFHPFHIHVNPFQFDRSEPNETGAIVRANVWKDTILANKTTPPPLKTRYLRFTGDFVLHCHILTHEDQGMMQMVRITD